VTNTDCTTGTCTQEVYCVSGTVNTGYKVCK
jgi:hypothetical protein